MFIVTGGAGFIGSCLVKRLNQEGIEDILIVDHLGLTEKWRNLTNKLFADYLEKDTFLSLIEKNGLDKKVEAVFHLGACSSTTEQDASYLLKNNYQFSKVLAKWSLAKKIPFIYASSAATYGDGSQGYADNEAEIQKLRPLNMYGYSKQLFDLWILRNKLMDKIVGIKFFNVYGPNEYHKGDMRSLVVKAFEQIQKEKKIRLFKSYKPEYKDGEQKRDFLYVKDAIEIVMEFFKKPKIRGIYNLGSGVAKTWNDLANALFKALGQKPNIEYIEMPEILRDKYQYFTQADLKKLRAAGVQHKFMDLDGAVADYVTFLKDGKYF